jgi:hypothetical protein
MNLKKVLLIGLGIFMGGLILFILGIAKDNMVLGLLGFATLLFSLLFSLFPIIVIIYRYLQKEFKGLIKVAKQEASERSFLFKDFKEIFKKEVYSISHSTSESANFISKIDRKGFGKYQVKCPFCKSKISADALKCPHCTADLTGKEIQSEIEKQILEIKKNTTIAVIFILLISFFVLFISLTSSPLTSQQQITELKIGDEGFLKVGNDPNQVVFLATDLDTFDKLLKVIQAKDEYALLNFALQGKVFGVTNGTKVKIIDKSFGKRKVRIIQGVKPVDEDKVGLSGWVPVEWVVSQF